MSAEALLPGTLELRPARGEWIGILLGCLVFVTMGLTLPSEGVSGAFDLFGVAFFGLGALMAALQLLPGLNALTVTPNGFIVRALWRRSTFDFGDFVGPFRVVRTIGVPRPTRPGLLSRLSPAFRQELVGFRMSGPNAEGRLVRWNERSYGVHGALPDTYGMPIDDLIALLNGRLEVWRAQSR